MHCGDLNGKEIQKIGDKCICIADSFFFLNIFIGVKLLYNGVLVSAL